MTSFTSLLCSIWLTLLPTIMLPTSMADALLHRIQEDLREDVSEDSYDLILENDRGQITVYGVVRSEAAKTSLTNAIKNVSGVLGVENRTKVAPGVFDPHYLKGPDTLAEEVREAIRTARPGGYKINIKSSGARVIISGSANDAGVREGILTAARGVPGVQYVGESIVIPTDRKQLTPWVAADRSESTTANTPPARKPNLKVIKENSESPRPFKRQTRVIAPKAASVEEDVRERVQRAGFQNDQVTVSESNGVVTLKGDVPQASDANKIHSLILMAEGVKSIDNHLTVKGKRYRAATIE